MTRTFTLASVGIAALALAGCTVGPDYAGPPTHIAPVAEQATGFRRTGEIPVAATPPVADWWSALGDPELDTLIAAGLADSPTVQAGEARLRGARAMLREQHRNGLPSASVSAAYLKSNAGTLTGAVAGDDAADGGGTSSSSSGGGGLELYNVSADATWEIDIFGGQRRATESARSQAAASAADLADIHVSLAAEIAQAYVDLRDQQQRVALLRRSAVLQQQVVDLIRQRQGRGASSSLDLERQLSQLGQTRSAVVPLIGNITVTLDRLALLTGREPGSLDARLTPVRPLPTLPASVAISDPSSLIRRRPDIRKAERTLAARTAVIGQRTADLFPKVTLIGLLGTGGTGIGDLFSGGSFTYALAPLLQWNFLDLGRTRAKIDQATAQRDEAEAQYRSAVLTALNDAESALARFGNQRHNLVALAQTNAAAGQVATLTRQRRFAGVASEIDALGAERDRITSEQALASGQADLIRDFVAIQKSLGLGWAPPAS